MFWPVTLLGVIAGLFIASIPGALLGGLLGQVVDRRLKLDSWASLRDRLRRSGAVAHEDLLFLMLGRLAKSEGRVLELHIQQARAEMRRLGLDDAGQRRAIAAFTRGKAEQVELRGPLRGLRYQRAQGEALLRSCWQMAAADGRVGQRERELILLWGKWLDWPADQVEALCAGFDVPGGAPVRRGSAYQDALSLLGVNANSEPAAIKRAYRRLISQNHPDKLAGAGATPQRVREATEKTRELHNAYSLIRERHGFR
ncbi:MULTISPECIES: TerB family tellurite resistance protein [unclassified Pseudomonas]|jgi:DnaJ like chaperone protein|uniref:TerB family tellurite resistance protein n=1 Tax=unclassified Pseudomonas TaxID=196821 RepID=UPI000DA6ED25|nr:MULTISPECIES: TerB family tellurite resistance protein [unclassified Pseudomonas]MDW3715511.1 DnaJ domain-containing protein [Pseudomonas sp. 2023EL-01195]PZE12127.1 molecular chaperone DjlA [Pseudomonas sp. 57B-090624]